MYIESQQLFIETAKASDLTFKSGGFVTTDATWHQEPLYASYSRVYYVVAGAGILYSEEESIPLEPGYVYLAPCGMKYGFRGNDSVTKLFFHVNIQLDAQGYDAFADCTHFIRMPYRVEETLQLKEWYLGTDPTAHLLLKSAIFQTVATALRLAKERDGNIDRYSKPVTDAMRYIHQNLRADLSVRKISEAVFYSQSKLSALFREEVGQSVARYIDDLLMSEAQSLLLYSDLPIGGISERLGFCDQFYFSRCFTKRFSVSPKQFRSER